MQCKLSKEFDYDELFSESAILNELNQINSDS